MSAICAYCGKPVDKNGVKYRSQQYHPECMEKKRSEAFKSHKQTVKDNYDPDASSLTAWLEAHTDEVDLGMKRLIEKYRSEGWTCGDVLRALRFFFDIEGNEWENNSSLGIVPYVMDKAKAYWKEVEAIGERNRHFVPNERTYTVMIQKEPPRKRELFDISSL